MRPSTMQARPRPRPSEPGLAAALWSGTRAVATGSFAVVRRRPVLVLAAVTIIGGGGLFGWNALVGQKGRHPAPLFAGKPEPVLVEPPRRPDVLATNTVGQIREPVQAVQPPAPAGPDKAARGGGGDPIGALIRSGDGGGRSADPARGGDAAKADPARAEAAKAEAVRVAAAQKALAKIGYGPLKADGIMGTGTRQAIERFERERKLPVSGGLNPRTSKQLAAASGITIQ